MWKQQRNDEVKDHDGRILLFDFREDNVKSEMDQKRQAKNAKSPGDIGSVLRFGDGVAADV